ncbi:hypothetical protein ACQW02_03810 [Humitalea sp. 24SJ18S-53]|uniref:hypothetical protein n=1 Tax=Humitalea sp. 24SJ18S-53 TaxID=3422307 RepID=UPI003D67BC4E
MTGFRFDVALAPGEAGTLVTELVELDGIPAIGHRLRVRLKRDAGQIELDLMITGITWFHAPSNMSKSGLLVLAGLRT